MTTFNLGVHPGLEGAHPPDVVSFLEQSRSTTIFTRTRRKRATTIIDHCYTYLEAKSCSKCQSAGRRIGRLMPNMASNSVSIRNEKGRGCSSALNQFYPKSTVLVAIYIGERRARTRKWSCGERTGCTFLITRSRHGQYTHHRCVLKVPQSVVLKGTTGSRGQEAATVVTEPVQ